MQGGPVRPASGISCQTSGVESDACCIVISIHCWRVMSTCRGFEPSYGPMMYDLRIYRIDAVVLDLVKLSFF